MQCDGTTDWQVVTEVTLILHVSKQSEKKNLLRWSMMATKSCKTYMSKGAPVLHSFPNRQKYTILE